MNCPNPNCNKANAAGMDYCDFCGTPLSSTPKRRTVAEGDAGAPTGASRKRLTMPELPTGRALPAAEDPFHPSVGFTPIGRSDPSRSPGQDVQRTRVTKFDPGPPSPPQQAPRPTIGRRIIGWLVTFDGYPDGMSFILREGRTIIGRNTDCDVSLPADPMASASHAFVIWRTGHARIADNNTQNGTFLNGEDVLGQVEVKDNDVIRVGGTRLLVRLLDAQKMADLWAPKPAGT